MSRMSCCSAPCAVVVGILTLFAGLLPAQEHGIDPTRLPGVVIDDTAAKKEGTWQSSRSVRPYVQAGYIHSAGGAGERVEFPVEIKDGGSYQILAAYTPGKNRSENAVYEIPTANGVQTVVVNQ